MPNLKKNMARSRRRRYYSDEDREDELINLAENLAEEKLRNGTASSQLITHYLKYGAERKKAELELKKLKADIRYQEAKREAIASSKRIEELYSNAMQAFGEYRGQSNRHRIEDDYDED